MSATLCPPSCRSRCSVEHHPLLVATLNCPTDASDAALAHWRNVVFGFQQAGKWNWNVPIPDPVPAYRMPLLHWACYLGKVSIVKYMLRCAGSFSRAVALPPTERVVYSQLVQGDIAGGNTPIHLCCEMLAGSGQDVQRGNKYIRCLDQLLYFITARQQDPANGKFFEEYVSSSILFCSQIRKFNLDELDGLQWMNVINCPNASGDTPMHIVARNDALHSLVQQMIMAGANPNIASSGLTPLDIARQCNNTQIIHLLSNVYAERQDDYDDDDEDVGVKVAQITSLDGKRRELSDSEISKLSLQHTLSQFGLTLSDDCDSDELMSCFKQVQQSKDVVWIESIRSAVINNLKELESLQECLTSRMTDFDSEMNALNSKSEKDSDDVTRLKTKLESLHRKRKQVAKQNRRTEQRIEKLQAKRKAATQRLSLVKSHRR